MGDDTAAVANHHGHEDESGSFSEEESNLDTSSIRSTSTPGGDNMLAQRETRWVMYSKLAVLIVLVLAAVSTSVGIYFNTKDIEENKFKTRFEDFANQILSVSQLNAKHIFQTYDALSLEMTSRTMSRQWPFITFAYFETLVGQAVKYTGANFVGFTPLVKDADRVEYEAYAYDNQEWIQDGLNYSGNIGFVIPEHTKVIHCLNGNLLDDDPCPTKELYAPVRHVAPLMRMGDQLGFDAFSFSFFKRVYDGMLEAGEAVLSEIMNLDENEQGYDEEDTNLPASFMAVPIYKTREQVGNPVGVLTAELPWDSYFSNLIPKGVPDIVLVVRNTCDQEFTYLIEGPIVTFLGRGDLHDPEYTSYEVSEDFTTFKSIAKCQYSFHVFPSDEFASEYETNIPRNNAIGVMVIFLICMVVFFIYDCLVERRKETLMSSATKTGLLVNSLFPENVRDRLLEDALLAAKKKADTPKTGRERLLRKSSTGTPSPDLPTDRTSQSGLFFYKNQPIADLFPNSTVLFADLVGFTAWSSVREPPQVFILLETVYNNFDLIARKLRVFKVETIGDCYVAATGLPVPREDHAVAMARFARYCMAKLNELVNMLEIDLGIGTSELAMRFGIHSGPVTAGVLRGEKSRFQLFGDTVNTAARMESNGKRDCIHISQETADLLIAAGKTQWITKREDKIIAKGKGELQTYWLSPRLTSSSGSSTSASTDDFSSSHRDSAMSLDAEEMGGLPALESPAEYMNVSADKRLIQWNVDLLKTLLKKVIAGRDDADKAKLEELAHQIGIMNVVESGEGETALDEVEEVIAFPEKVVGLKRDPKTIELNAAVDSQLHDYVSTIASLYKDCPFHCFAHATHAGQSVSKLLSRIVTNKSIDYNDMSYKPECGTKRHDNTFGITSDPVAQFACAFATLIQDVDHPGVPNSVLAAENSKLVAIYKNKSIAEQNSLDVGWNLFMQPQYKDLRACIYTTQSELNRFRQLMVNTVLATDVLDEELRASRNARWEHAFSDQPDSSPESPFDCTGNTDCDRKATLVVEHLVQASDLAHMMQHWHIYIKWNEKFFLETYRAFKAGRIKTDPAVSWYKGELEFFDTTVIPLATKLQECGVFGVSSDEYLNYAISNRREWEVKGKETILGYLSKVKLQEELDELTDMKLVS